MTILELADILDADLIVRRYANQDNRWMVEFDAIPMDARNIKLTYEIEEEQP